MFYFLTDFGSICTQKGISEVLDAIGVIVTILKWLIPVALIIMGTIDLGQAVMEQDEGNIKKAYTKLIKRAIAAILVFIFPSIVVFLVNAFSGESSSAASVCIEKILGKNPFN